LFLAAQALVVVVQVGQQALEITERQTLVVAVVVLEKLTAVLVVLE
jgi:hypothetical protein